MEVDPGAERKIVELWAEGWVWKVLIVPFFIFMLMWLPKIYHESAGIREELKKISEQQEKQGTLLKKVHEEKKQDQKKISAWI